MKAAISAFVVLAASGKAAASWLDWLDPDVTVTNTLTRTVQYCPCNGEVYTPTGEVGPIETTPTGPRTITKAGPIVVVYTTEGYLTTKTGIAIELYPTDGAPGSTVTKTVWTGAQPTDDLAWIDWSDDDVVDGATLTRTHTEFTTVIGPAPTSDEPEPWSDWVATTNSPVTTSTTTPGNVGPIGGSTTSSGYWSSLWTSSSSSSSNDVGPIGGSTTTSSSLYSTSTTTSSGGDVGPIGGSTTTTSSLTTTPVTSSTIATTTTSAIGSPVEQTTSSTTEAVGTTTTSAALTTTTTSAIVATTTSAASATQTVNVGTDYISGILEAHNLHRANHSAADLTWSTNLATIAGETASSCVYAHDITTGGGGYGQNIGAGYLPVQVPSMIGNDMYNREMPLYPGPYDSNNVDTSTFASWGHFTQIVWKGTQQVGCATQYCPQGLTNAAFAQYFTVCNYYPPGNIEGAYANIGAPLGEPITVVIEQ
ncbi:hypothetical protein A1O3_04670 [Capronia epimyces CBS 606.96]|uniref:SCP domain-containing protein n=1 Tax=Capronia epimyces CBS 606.96 TaxID=1182542 RepID=W9XUW0_9EURO|nr:uncharacterized protein A1O3_04670 [Capronia epimyces CBS 606.96]EXJ84003.1 hypothetical protein A1O3_04670 [Capronia epimyces CBS 606.96]